MWWFCRLEPGVKALSRTNALVHSPTKNTDVHNLSWNGYDCLFQYHWPFPMHGPRRKRNTCVRENFARASSVNYVPRSTKSVFYLSVCTLLIRVFINVCYCLDSFRVFWQNQRQGNVHSLIFFLIHTDSLYKMYKDKLKNCSCNQFHYIGTCKQVEKNSMTKNRGGNNGSEKWIEKILRLLIG